MDIVTVFRAFNLMEAEVVRSRLETAGFNAVITHGLAALSMDGYSVATGGILVQVPPEEEANALLLINSEGDDAPTA